MYIFQQKKGPRASRCEGNRNKSSDPNLRERRAGGTGKGRATTIKEANLLSVGPAGFFFFFKFIKLCKLVRACNFFPANAYNVGSETRKADPKRIRFARTGVLLEYSDVSSNPRRKFPANFPGKLNNLRVFLVRSSPNSITNFPGFDLEFASYYNV